MLHPTCLGFFDRELAQQRRLVALRPIDTAVVASIAGPFSPTYGDGEFSIRSDRFCFIDGYLRCLDVVRSREAADFIADVARATSCQILFTDAAEFYTPEQFLEKFETISRYREELRQRARNRRSSSERVE